MLSFYRIPKLLFTSDYFRELSTDAKVLYGLMLDRMSLSIKNKWFDAEKRAYIYFSVEDTMEMLNCKKNKALDTLKALEEFCLIERKRQGQGKPAIIYVKFFMEGQTEIDIAAVTNRIIRENPCGISLGESKYPYMIKMFLYSAFCGMTASTLWDGRSTVKGGYITVKETGEVVANYALESESFKNFLFSHCYLDFPSTDQGHGDYGRVYEENGDYYFKLNFQIRIR